MKVLVSACVMGENCKYNGKNNRSDAIVDLLRGHEVVRVCPEVMGGLPTPRPCAEIVNGRVLDQYGRDVHSEYTAGVEAALAAIRNMDVDLAILQSRSPACGVDQIYDGSFGGKLIDGMGVFARALKERGYRVIDAADTEAIRAALETLA